MKKLIFTLMICSLFAEKVESVEKINITQEEINNQFEELKKNPGKDNITKKKLNTNQKNQIENVIRENLLVEKALERLIEIATKNQ